MKNCFIEKESSVKRYTMPLFHSHNYYELYFLQQGNRSFYIENDSFSLSNNDLILVPAKFSHRTTGENFTRYIVNFTHDFLRESEIRIIELCERQPISMQAKEAEKVFDILDTLLLIQSDNTKQNLSNKDYNFNVCFSYLLFTLSTLKNFPKQKYVEQKGYRPRTKKIMAYIQEHFKEPINLDYFCRMFFISEHALCSSFKKDTGMTIINYLLNTRLKNAQRLLTYSNKKIQQISDECGFSSPKYFNRIFKQVINASPSEFRKTNRIVVDYSGGGEDKLI